MAKYQQLQEYLNKQIEKGRKPRGEELFTKIFIDINGNIVALLADGNVLALGNSVKDLISIESGLADFIERKSEKNAIHFIDKHAVGYDMIMDDKAEYHYMIMGPMTAEMKVDYFLNNVL